MINSYHKEAGQGLIETLVIVVFVSVSIIAMIQFQHYLSYSSEIAHQQGDAVLIAVNKLETLKNFSVLNTTSGYTAYSDIASGTGSTTVSNTTYSITWTVTTFSSPAYKTIAVTVSWTDRFGNSQSISEATQVAGVDPAAAASFM